MYAAVAADSLEKLKGDSLAVLEYHWYDSFENPDDVGRINYYGIPGIPWPLFDGRYTEVNVDSETFNTYLSAYEAELLSGSLCAVNVFVEYDSTTRFLEVKSRVSAVDTLSSMHLLYAIAESHIYSHWQGLDSLHHVVRKMLPDYNGVTFSLNPGESFVDSQTCVLNSAWSDKNCYVVVFVQRDDSVKSVLESAKSGLFRILTWVFGDANKDGTVDLTDIVYLMNYLFALGPPPDPFPSGDSNSDCIINVMDVIYLMNYVFIGGPQPQKGCAW
jgi:hypothetical protein